MAASEFRRGLQRDEISGWRLMQSLLCFGALLFVVGLVAFWFVIFLLVQLDVV